MPSTTIVTEGDPVLRKKALPVPKELFNSKELSDIIYAMTKALRKTSHGVAIAAPQIGISYRIFVVRGFVMEGHEKNDFDFDVAFINPEIIKNSKEKTSIDGEGCLSVPGMYGTVERYEKTKVRAYDLRGSKFERGGSGLLAEIFQHEIDHLNGILFIDHATNLKKVEDEHEG